MYNISDERVKEQLSPNVKVLSYFKLDPQIIEPQGLLERAHRLFSLKTALLTLKFGCLKVFEIK